MKKSILSVLAIALAFAFTGCKDDLVAPEITLPEDANVPVFQLGDTQSALEGVTANDAKDGDVTANLSVLGLDYVGNTTLVYSAFDAANNVATAERPAVVGAARLSGTYAVSSKNMEFPDNEPYSYNAKVTLSQISATRILIANLAGYGEEYAIGEAYGDGTNTLILEGTVETNAGNARVQGTITYGPTSTEGQYTLLVADYTLETPGVETIHYVDTFTLK